MGRDAAPEHVVVQSVTRDGWVSLDKDEETIHTTQARLRMHCAQHKTAACVTAPVGISDP
jgi:hypothetical protein